MEVFVYNFINWKKPHGDYIKYLFNLFSAGSAHINSKKRDKKERQVRKVKKEIKAQRVKSPTSTQAIDALMRDEQLWKKKEKKKELAGF